MIRKTIVKNTSLTGIGLHTGIESTVTMEPAEVNSGIRFTRSDLDGSPSFLADVNMVSDTNRSTCLKKGDVEVKCSEHILSALAGLGVTDINISVDGPEIPILDGSAKPFIQALESVGIRMLEEEVEPLVIDTPFQFTDEDSGSTYSVMPSEKTELTVLIDFDSDTLGEQYATWKEGDDYPNEIAPSKTFVFVHDLKLLLEHNLIKGGALENAIVIADQRSDEGEVEDLAKALEAESLLKKKSGVLNPQDLTFSNEAARHKLLDLMGDLALLGRPVQAKIIAEKPGHQGNVALTKVFKKILVEQRKLKGKPKYDPNAKPILSIEEVKKMLPHRYPFLMVDKIIEIDEAKVVGVKNTTGNEELFQGHFPGNPVFPGVLQMEALAQTGGILALSTVEEPHLWDTYFLKMDNVKFKSMVTPGDTLILKMELLSPIRRGIVHMQGTAYVGDRIVSEGELTAQIIKRS
jgi:UDP-3-O-[3-hydroxymyristoyl] N-acetylglucosamine deacetylase/3-hydroxyacyl-[acyl-carrier-protein] dehydratase